MSKCELIVSTPYREFYKGNVDKIIVRSSDGDICILRGHANMVTTLETGPLLIIADNQKRYAALSGGFMKVDKKNTIILANTCEWAEEIDINRAKNAEKNAIDKLNSKSSKHEMDIAELSLKRALNRISVHHKSYDK